MFIIRLLNGKSPFVGDRNHMHHLLIDTGYSHMLSTFILLAYNILIFSLYLIFKNQSNINITLFYLFINFIIYCLIGNYLSKKIDSKSIERLQFSKIDKIKRLQMVDQFKPEENKDNTSK